MTIRYKCEECGSVLNIKDEKAGTQGRCPKCKAEFLVPAPAGTADVVADGDAAGTADTVRAPASASTASASTAGGDLSEDEIEMLLEAGDNGSPDKRPGGGYGVASVDDDETEADEETDDDGLNDDEDESPRSRSSRRTVSDETDDDLDDDKPRSNKKDRGKAGRRSESAVAEPTESVAGIAKSLMARDKRGDKAGVVERDGKKGSRPFGGEDRDDDEGGSSVKEIAAYLARYALPVTVCLALGIGYYIWWFNGWKRGELPDLVPISGTVKLDGKPLHQAQVLFIPQPAGKDDKTILKKGPSLAFTDQNGRYTLIYKAPVQGAVIGSHLVQISATDKEGHELIPMRFGARSKTIVEVKAGGNNAQDFDIPSAEPEGTGAIGGISQPPGQ